MGCENWEKIDTNEGDLINGLPSVIIAAHELKSPLILMRQLSLMLCEGDLSKTEQNRMLNQINLTSEKAIRLTTDLTKTVRLNDSLFKLEPINPKQLCEDIIREMEPMFRAYSRKIKFISTKKPPLVVGNRDLLRRVIMNLSDNAIYYTEKNEQIELKINSFKKRQVVRLSVRDFGPALPKNTLKNLDKKLNNHSNTTVHARPQSSGLGLYIVGRFAEAMNAKVGLIRHRDGASFFVDLQSSRQLSLL